MYLLLAFFLSSLMIEDYIRCEKLDFQSADNNNQIAKCNSTTSEKLDFESSDNNQIAKCNSTTSEKLDFESTDNNQIAKCNSTTSFLFSTLILTSLSFFALIVFVVIMLWGKEIDDGSEFSLVNAIFHWACPAFVITFSALIPIAIPVICFLICYYSIKGIKQQLRNRSDLRRQQNTNSGQAPTSISVVSAFRNQTSRSPTSKHLKELQNRGFIEKVKQPTVLELIERLIKDTWQPSLTGVGRDARGLTHSNIQICDVYLIQNESLTTRYNEAYVRCVCRGIVNNAKATFKTQEVLPSNAEIETGLFEVLMFHGTKMDNVAGIITEGFKAEKNRNSMYGKGTYVTDSAQKADQYTDTNNSRGRSELTMFVVRVALGWMVDEQFQHLDCDTVLAGKGNLFQELIVKRDKLVLPLYLIIYDRV